MRKIKSVTSPTLVAGAVDIRIGELEKVSHAIAKITPPWVGAAGTGVLLKTAEAISGNIVTVTVSKVDLEEATDANRDWEVAVTADVDAKTITVDAEGI